MNNNKKPSLDIDTNTKGCKDCIRCYNTTFSTNCENLYNCSNMKNSRFCINCDGLENEEYCIDNKFVGEIVFHRYLMKEIFELNSALKLAEQLTEIKIR